MGPGQAGLGIPAPEICKFFRMPFQGVDVNEALPPLGDGDGLLATGRQ
jgi:hypothetical protein